MIGYLWQYIFHYITIVKPLQLHKTLLNQRIHQHHGKNAGKNQQQRLASHTSITEPTPKELNAFHQLQTLFSRPTILSHFNPKQQLYIDLNVLKEFSFGTHVYHMKPGSEGPLKGLTLLPMQKQMKPILFLSHLLTDAKTQYWSTELEVADIV